MRSASLFAVIVDAAGGVVGMTLPNITWWSYKKSNKILP
jgi:hypothetical protein